MRSGILAAMPLTSTTAARRLAMFGLALTPPTLFLAWAISPSGLPITGAVLLVGFTLAVRSMASQYPHTPVGACNLVTAIRLALTAALAASLAGIAPGTAAWLVFGLAALTLALDGIDGWLARAQRLTSDFGARFDMEVDAALAAVLALSALTGGRAGPELVVLGGARYAFVAAAIVLPWLAARLPASWRRKAVCVVQIATLAALVLPILPDELARPMALTAAALVLGSFWCDIRWLKARA